MEGFGSIVRYFSPVRLPVNEIESVRLAFRLFSRKIRLPFLHASSSLRKLAIASERASPAISRRLLETADSWTHTPFRALRGNTVRSWKR